MKKLWAMKDFRLWLAIVGTSTFVLGAAYAFAQQSTRLAADDLPLINLQTAKNKLATGANPADVVSKDMSDLAKDSIPFVFITDNSHQLIATSALMDGETPPLPPNGVFEYTKEHGSDRFTWQPQDNIRLATRVEKYDNGFIVAGQSLKEPENRIAIYTVIAAVAWIMVVVWTFLTLALPSILSKR